MFRVFPQTRTHLCVCGRERQRVLVCESINVEIKSRPGPQGPVRWESPETTMMVWEAICVWIPSVPFGGSEIIMGNSDKISGFQIPHLRNGNSLPCGIARTQGMMSGMESCSKTSISCFLWVSSSILGSHTSLGLRLNIWLLSLRLAELENVDCHLLNRQIHKN